MAAAGIAAWKAVSKQATAGTSGQDRVHRGQRRERLRLVERGEVGERPQVRLDLVVEEDRPAVPRPAVDDPVADRPERAEAGDGLGDGRRVGRPARGRQVGRRDDVVGRVEDAQLEAARPGVDDEDAGGGVARGAGVAASDRPGALAAYAGQAQSRISGASSPSSRV